MSISVSFHGLEEARAEVLKTDDPARPWFVVLSLHAGEGQEMHLFAPYQATRVEAIMAAFEMVDAFKAALTTMSDVVLTEDMSASIEKKKMVQAVNCDADPAAEARAKATAGITDPESVLVYDLSGPDGPVADSVDGYKVTAEEIRAETGEEPREIPPGKLPSGEDAPDHLVRRMADGRFEEGA